MWITEPLEVPSKVGLLSVLQSLSPSLALLVPSDTTFDGVGTLDLSDKRDTQI